MKRYIMVYKEEKRNLYTVVDLYTSRLWKLKKEALYDKIKSGEFDIDNVELRGNSINIIWNPLKIDNETFLIARYENLVLTVNCVIEGDVRVQDKNLIFDRFGKRCYIDEIVDKVPDLYSINRQANIFNNKAKLVEYPMIIFPINEDNAMLKKTNSSEKSILIPNCCTILNYGSHMIVEEGFMSYKAKIVPYEMKSGFENIKYINASCFDQNNIQDVSKFTNVIEIGNRAFKTNKVKEIVIPKSCKYIGNEAFYRSAVNELIIDCGNLKLGDHVFAGCMELESVVLKGNIQLGHGTFLHCEKLNSVTLSDEIENIPDKCFAECNNLKEITIPKNIKNISHTAFYCDKSLEKVIIAKELLDNTNIRNWVMKEMLGKPNIKVEYQ